MPIIGYCHDCTEWVWVTSDWACPKGHAAARVNGWYDSESGAPAAPQAVAASVPAPAVVEPAVVAEPVQVAEPTAEAGALGTRVAFLTDLMAAFAQSPSYTAAWGNDTDMTIASNPIDGMWGAGKKRAEYTAALKVSEPERTVTFWEMLKEHSSGFTFGTIESETYTTFGTKRSGKKKEVAIGPGAASWEWGYGTTRKVVEEVAARHGFSVRVVLTKRAASW